MYNMKLALGTSVSYKMSVEDQIRLFSKVGFEGFFTGMSEDNELFAKVGRECGMIYQSIHAPFTNAAKMWQAGAEESIDELIFCAETCARAEAPIMIVHAYIGFDKNSEGASADFYARGIENYSKVVERAGELGIKVAIENTEGEDYLKALMNAFSGYKNVGFCWDTGHELCYNYSKDMTALYGDRLIATHINDNLGIRDFGGEITWHDDLHLLPFDGISDMDSVARRLARSNIDILTFELARANKPDRLDNQKYINMTTEEYITEAYARACRVATLVKKYKEA